MQHISNEIELSVVMPCLNEAETLEVCVKKALKFFSDYQVKGEVVVADNGSTDGSQEIARRNGARVVDVPQKGYGSALKGGFLAAEGRYLIMGDSDDSYDFSSLMPFVEKMRAGDDFVMGNRFKGGIEKGAMPFLHYYLGNPVLSFIGRLFFKSNIGDFHCGLRGFTKKAFLLMDPQTTGMEFASELIMKATLLKMKISEVPIKLYPDGRSRPPHLRTWRDGWRHLRFMLIYAPTWLFLIPGLLFMAFGMLVGGAIVVTPLRLGQVVFDINTLIYMAILVLIGFQSVSFYVHARLFAMNSGILPRSKRFFKMLDTFSLEHCIVLSLVLILLGLGGTFYALDVWSEKSFGKLEPQQALRIVIPSTLSLLIGFQLLLGSFFNSILSLKRIKQ
jgi:glycosyltransferase involved in cell wall biosynthesis